MVKIQLKKKKRKIKVKALWIHQRNNDHKVQIPWKKETRDKNESFDRRSPSPIKKQSDLPSQRNISPNKITKNTANSSVPSSTNTARKKEEKVFVKKTKREQDFFQTSEEEKDEKYMTFVQQKSEDDDEKKSDDSVITKITAVSRNYAKPPGAWKKPEKYVPQDIVYLF